MCVSALIISKEIIFSYAGLPRVVMRGRYVGLTLPNQSFSYRQAHRQLAYSVSSDNNFVPLHLNYNETEPKIVERASIYLV